jgi:hypothetical protein
MSKKYGRSPEEIRLEIADAVGSDEDVVEHFRQLTRARGWKDAS